MGLERQVRKWAAWVACGWVCGRADDQQPLPQGQALLQNKSEQDNGGGAARDRRPRQQYVSLVAGMNMK
ncbi:hypothetical protein E2C01_093193 [Portunus trituberculatus]|uniref:Uncharacterized protein n=1 Tax=Portunus trituberculatus TaxID=210409 RepID=A0A5B7JU72_PORTR|nr:hypothetical protein [Portunus trituberculatus]